MAQGRHASAAPGLGQALCLTAAAAAAVEVDSAHMYVCVHTHVFSHGQGMTHASVRACVCALTQWELVQGVCGDGTLDPLGTRGSMITWAWAPELV